MSCSVNRQPLFDNTVGKAVVLEPSSVSFVRWGKWGTSIIHEVYPTNDATDALGYQSDFHLVDKIRRNSGIAVGDRPPIYTVDIGPGKSTSPLWSWLIDYGVVLKGSVSVDLADGESRGLREGEVILPRGSVHTWMNRSQEWSKISFVLQEPNQAFDVTDVLDHRCWYRSEDIEARLLVESLLGEF